MKKATDAQVEAGALALWRNSQGCTVAEAKERWDSVLEDFRNVYRKIARIVIEAALNTPERDPLVGNIVSSNQTGE